MDKLNHRANDLYLTLINDGRTYQRRVAAARNPHGGIAAGEWVQMVRDTARESTRKFQPAEPYTVFDILAAAHALAEYYQDHVAEMES